MPNYTIDRQFFDLLTIVREKSAEAIKETMLHSFRRLNDANQKVLEDYFDKYPFWGTLHDRISDHDCLYKKAFSLKTHVDDYQWLYENLSDYRSKATLYGVLSNWLHFTSMSLYKETLFSDYFDLDLFPCSKNEVFVDVGAYIGDTTISYITAYGLDSYDKIYCYEITPSIFNQLKSNLSDYRNIECRELGLSDKEGVLSLQSNGIAQSNHLVQNGDVQVKVTTMDLDIEQPVSFIKMDIEGSEKPALTGSKKHILADRPKLAIAVYHQNDDLWEIPKMIRELHSDYKLYLRYHGEALYPTETTLLAI